MDILTHLKERHLDLDKVRCFVDTASNVVTFPLYSLDRRWVGYQKYNPLGSKLVRKSEEVSRYYTYLSEFAVWGLEYATADTLVVCEGVFKAARFVSAGVPAVATLCNDPPKAFMKQLREQYHLVAVLDPDVAGNALKKHVHEYFVPDNPVDQLRDEEFSNLLQLVKRT
jgi:hypothetical protein